MPRLWECGYPSQGCSSWGVSWGRVGKLKGNKLSGGGREETQAGEALRLLRSSSECRGWCRETQVRLRIINVRRGSASLGHLLESFGWGQNFANLNFWAFRRAGSHLLHTTGASGASSLGEGTGCCCLCCSGTVPVQGPRAEQEHSAHVGGLKDTPKARNNVRM